MMYRYNTVVGNQLNMVDGIPCFYEKHGHDQCIHFTSPISSPFVGIFTSGRVGVGTGCDDFRLGLGTTSIVITIITTNADKVTNTSLSILEALCNEIYGSQTALRMLSHLISSTSVRISLISIIALFKRVCNENTKS